MMSKWQCTVHRNNELDRGGNSKFLDGLRNLHTQKHVEMTLRDEASPNPIKDEREQARKWVKAFGTFTGSRKKLHDTQSKKQNRQMVLKGQCGMYGSWERYKGYNSGILPLKSFRIEDEVWFSGHAWSEKCKAFKDSTSTST